MSVSLHTRPKRFFVLRVGFRSGVLTPHHFHKYALMQAQRYAIAELHAVHVVIDLQSSTRDWVRGHLAVRCVAAPEFQDGVVTRPARMQYTYSLPDTFCGWRQPIFGNWSNTISP